MGKQVIGPMAECTSMSKAELRVIPYQRSAAAK